MKLIKIFCFGEYVRNKIVLGANVRLDPADGMVKLKATDGVFPTTANLSFRTWLTKPKAARSWFAFEANASVPEGTSVGFRLSPDGVVQLFWNGSAWIEAAPGNWNTEAEVSENIGAFPIEQRAIQVISNLATTNATLTPSIKRIKIGYVADIDFFEDLFLRSLVPALSALTAPGQHQIKTAVSGNTIDLSSMETQYNLASVDSVYNLSSDPAMVSNLLQSFDANTKLVTLNTTVPPAVKLQINFNCHPEVAIATSVDYIEFAKVPCVLVENIRESHHYDITNDDHIIQSREDGIAWEQVGGEQRTMEMSISWTTNKILDIARLGTSIENFFKNGELTSVGMDETYGLQLVSSRNFTPSANRNDAQQARLTARIRDALFYTSDAKQVALTKRFVATGGNLEVTVE